MTLEGLTADLVDLLSGSVHEQFSGRHQGRLLLRVDLDLKKNKGYILRHLILSFRVTHRVTHLRVIWHGGQGEHTDYWYLGRAWIKRIRTRNPVSGITNAVEKRTRLYTSLHFIHVSTIYTRLYTSLHVSTRLYILYIIYIPFSKQSQPFVTCKQCLSSTNLSGTGDVDGDSESGINLPRHNLGGDDVQRQTSDLLYAGEHQETPSYHHLGLGMTTTWGRGVAILSNESHTRECD